MERNRPILHCTPATTAPAPAPAPKPTIVPIVEGSRYVASLRDGEVVVEIFLGETKIMEVQPPAGGEVLLQAAELRYL